MGTAIMCAVLLAFGTGAQAAADAPGTMPPGQAHPPWDFSASAYAYFVPESDNYLQPTITADRGWLHLEARYNYEDQDAASAWIGYNFSVGDTLTLDITPMLGGVFGNTTGIAPGYHLTLSWKKLGFYTEGEYVLNTRERTDSFFYSWSELTLSPLDWFRLGLAAQRSRAYKSERDIQRGFLLGFSLGKVEVSGYVFNPDLDRPTYVLSVSGEF